MKICRSNYLLCIRIHIPLARAGYTSTSQSQCCPCCCNTGHPSRVISRCICSGALGMPCLLAMVALGLVLKVLEAVYWEQGIGDNAVAAAHRWLHYLVKGSSSARVASTVVGILFPLVGIVALKSMRRTENIRETIELATPVCGLNCLCIVCIILMMNSSCLGAHLSSTIMSVPVWEDSSSNMTLKQQAHGHSGQAVVRYQPILAVMAMPIPLVCSIVCIVTAGRNHRTMVSPAQPYVGQ